MRLAQRNAEAIIERQVLAVESKPATKGRIKTSHFFD